MPLQLTGRHMTIGNELKDYIDKKVNRLRRICGRIDELNFTLSREKLHIEAEGTLRSGKMTAHAKEKAPQSMEAVDMLVDKLEMQVSRAKEKRTDKGKGSREKALQQNALTQPEVFEPDADEEQAEMEA